MGKRAQKVGPCRIKRPAFDLHGGFKTRSLQSFSLQMPSSSHFAGTFLGTPQGEK